MTSVSPEIPIARSDTPRPIDEAFLADCLYRPEAVLIDELSEIDVEAGRLVARVPTSAEMPLTRAQRVDPLRHPRHVSGGLLVHLTGMMGDLHFYYVLGLRHADGWTGFGVRIHSARFPRLGRIGPPLSLSCEATRTRRLGKQKIYVRYAFRFEQQGEAIYEGDQSALFLHLSAGERFDI